MVSVGDGSAGAGAGQNNMSAVEPMTTVVRPLQSRPDAARQVAVRPQGAVALDFVNACLEHNQLAVAATALATRLTARLSCSRVSIGLSHGQHIRVCALSHGGQFDARSNLLRAISAAMDEAADQQATLVWPDPGEQQPPRITQAHTRLARNGGSAMLCSVPLTHGGEVVGAITLERSDAVAFDAATIELCEHVARVAGPILYLMYREERALPVKVWQSTRETTVRVFGPGRTAMRVGAAVAACLALFLTFASGEYRVAADARLEGSIQRVIAAPVKGFIASTSVRAGDRVNAGAPMATLDDKELKLERLRWESQRLQLMQQYRQALANHDRAQVAVLSARLQQARAQLGLVEEQLARMNITAPFDGVVIEGDLDQSLGSPVARGEVLFKVAPLEGYRVVLEMDESDIASVMPGQTGYLVLTTLPDTLIELTVDKITPVSVPEDGRNYFRVEARLEDTDLQLQPGLEGVAKVEVGQRKLIWIWTHGLLDRIRLWLWSRWP